MVTAVPPVQIGSVGLLVQVAMISAQPASVGLAVHWEKLNPVPVPPVPALPIQIAAVGFVGQVAMI